MTANIADYGPLDVENGIKDRLTNSGAGRADLLRPYFYQKQPRAKAKAGRYRPFSYMVDSNWSSNQIVAPPIRASEETVELPSSLSMLVSLRVLSCP